MQLDYLFLSQSIMAPICRAVDAFAVAVAVYLTLDILDVQSGLQKRYNRNSYTINTLIGHVNVFLNVRHMVCAAFLSHGPLPTSRSQKLIPRRSNLVPSHSNLRAFMVVAQW